MIQGRQILFTGAGKVSVKTFELGPPEPEEILIETLYSAISAGTERAHLLAEPNTGTHARGFPFQPGYSSVGRVVQVGSKVKHFRPNQLVADVRPHMSHAMLPETLGTAPLPEKYAERFRSPISPDTPSAMHYVWDLPDGLDAQTLKASSTFGISKVGLLGVRRARVEIGEAVLVVGLGPIGLHAALYAKLAGAVPVVGLDSSPQRRAFALELGLDAAYASEEEAAKALQPGGQPLMRMKGPAVVIEATGRPEPIPVAYRLCQRNGRVVLLGSTRGTTKEVNYYADVHRKGLTVYGVQELTRPFQESMPGNWTSWDDARVVLQLIQSGRLDVAPLITHELPASQAEKAYDVVRNDPTALTVVLDWTK